MGRRKRSKTEQVALAVILPLSLLFCLALSHLLTLDRAEVFLESEDGTWDLQGYDLYHTDVQLNGAVSCIPNALLTPEQFASREAEAILLKEAFSEEYGTSRLRLYLPDDGWYTLSRVSIDYATRLYVNGRLFTEVGSPAESRGEAVPGIGRITLTAQAENGVIELVQQSSNFVHRSGGYHGGWQVGGQKLMREIKAADFAVVLELGAYATLFLLHLLLFLTFSSYRPNLYFALYCLTWFLRMGTTGNAAFSVLLPGLSWGVGFRLEYACVSLAILLAVLILDDIFPGLLQKGAVYAVYGTNALFVLFCIGLDTVRLSWVAPAFLVLCALTGVYLVIRFAMKLRRIRLEQGLFLVGILLIICSALRDITLYARFVSDPSQLYTEMTQVAVLGCTLFGATGFITATMRERAEAKEAEQRLALENAALDQVSRLKTELMGTLSHELRTPLSVISGYAQLTARQIDSGSVSAETKENLSVISRESRRLAELAGGMLKAAGSSGYASDSEWSDLRVEELFERAAAVCRPILLKKGNRLKLCAGAELPLVNVSEDMVQQVLLNLVFNANRHMKDGVVTLRADQKALQTGFVRVTVADTGSGISPELLPKAFERHTGEKGGGAGLGLAICRDIIRIHGGDIFIESAKGSGTQVTFTLPKASGGERA